MRAEDPRNRRDEESTPGAMRAAHTREEPGVERRTGDEESEGGVLTLVCFTCGSEYFFGDTPPPEELECEKCGGGVFRSFYSATGDEVAQDFIDSTAREQTPDDPETDTAPGDILDLDRG
jgi:hypothetical protein